MPVHLDDRLFRIENRYTGTQDSYGLVHFNTLATASWWFYRPTEARGVADLEVGEFVKAVSLSNDGKLPRAPATVSPAHSDGIYSGPFPTGNMEGRRAMTFRFHRVY